MVGKAFDGCGRRERLVTDEAELERRPGKFRKYSDERSAAKIDIAGIGRQSRGYAESVLCRLKESADTVEPDRHVQAPLERDERIVAHEHERADPAAAAQKRNPVEIVDRSHRMFLHKGRRSAQAARNGAEVPVFQKGGLPGIGPDADVGVECFVGGRGAQNADVEVVLLVGHAK